MPRTNYNTSRAGFIADQHSIVRDPGRQIDWASVGTVAGVSGTDPVTGKKFINAGAPVGATLGAGKISPRVVTTNPAIGLLETMAIEGDPAASLSGYGVIIGGSVYQNLLAGGTPDAATKSELNAAGTGFAFQTYADTR